MAIRPARTRKPRAVTTAASSRACASRAAPPLGESLCPLEGVVVGVRWRRRVAGERAFARTSGDELGVPDVVGEHRRVGLVRRVDRFHRDPVPGAPGERRDPGGVRHPHLPVTHEAPDLRDLVPSQGHERFRRGQDEILPNAPEFVRRKSERHDVRSIPVELRREQLGVRGETPDRPDDEEVPPSETRASITRFRVRSGRPSARPGRAGGGVRESSGSVAPRSTDGSAPRGR